MQQNLLPPLQPGQCPVWCEREHIPGDPVVIHGVIVTYGEIEIVWVQVEKDGVVQDPLVRIAHPVGDRRRHLEWRPETSADVGDLLASIKVQDIADVAARLIASFDQLGGTL
ncbi:hypothetical protein [Streptosporangium sp. NPDC002524]|uniref:hypothetical protein n=1 Tax=Streptosporangium sp. NPDC002524 TaxID=3154537 RepID=UPI0033172280